MSFDLLLNKALIGGGVITKMMKKKDYGMYGVSKGGSGGVGMDR